MDLRELLELGALVAVHGPEFVEGRGKFAAPAAEPYWTAAKVRCDRWRHAWKELASRKPKDLAPHELARLTAISREILASELLTRTWTAACDGYDRFRGQTELEPLARNVMRGHLEARNRVLHWMMTGDGAALESAVELNRLRRRVERWCDMLLAHFSPYVAVDEFAFEPERARQFAADLPGRLTPGKPGIASQLALAALRSTIQQLPGDASPNRDLNRRIGSAILRCYGDRLLQGGPVAQKLWLERLGQSANDAEALLAEALLLEQPTGGWRQENPTPY